MPGPTIATYSHVAGCDDAVLLDLPASPVSRGRVSRASQPPANAAEDCLRLEHRARLPGAEFFVANPLQFAECWLPAGCGNDSFEDLFSDVLHRVAFQDGTSIQIHVV